MVEADVLFTVFTPTHNRKDTLPRVYQSLLNQTLERESFEWLIVDDGSVDGTEELIRTWIAEGRLLIRCVRQEQNGGKHRAWNVGIREAHGELFAPIDSDDACVPDALLTVQRIWMSADPADRAESSGVFTRVADPGGNVIGIRFPPKRMADRAELFLAFGMTSDLWMIFRTSVVREYPFPDGPKGLLVPEGAIWNQISKNHRCFLSDNAPYIYYSGSHGRADQLTRRRPIHQQAPGMVISLQSLLDNSFRFFASAPVYFARAAVHFVRFSMHEKRFPPRQINQLKVRGARMLCWATLPLAFALYLLDGWALDRERPT